VAYVVTEACINCKYTECVDVCPAECFYEGPNMLVIKPDECVDCGLCAPVCPVDAILPENLIPPAQLEFIRLNAEYSLQWPNIALPKEAMNDAEQWKAVKNKRDALLLSEPNQAQRKSAQNNDGALASPAHNLRECHQWML